MLRRSRVGDLATSVGHVIFGSFNFSTTGVGVRDLKRWLVVTRKIESGTTYAALLERLGQVRGSCAAGEHGREEQRGGQGSSVAMASADRPGSSSGLGLSKNFDESSAGLLAPEHLIAAVGQRSAGGAAGTDGACEVATEVEPISR